MAKYDLVLEGGGAKGLVFVGALREFKRQGHTFGRLLGTSVGAITATLLAAGYETEELLGALYDEEQGRPAIAGFFAPPKPLDESEIENSTLRELLRKQDVTWMPDRIENQFDNWVNHAILTNPRLTTLASLLERGSFHSADTLINWLEMRLDSGMYNGQPRQFSTMTLRSFYAATRCELSLVVANISAMQMMVLNQNTAPDCPVLAALQMATSIPIMFPTIEWQDAWGTYLGRDISGHVLVDGAILSNFPIELMLSDAPQVTRLMGENHGQQVMGLLIDETIPVPGAPPPVKKESLLNQLPVARLIAQMLGASSQARTSMLLEAVEALVVRLPAKGYDMEETDMSPARRDSLIAAGETAMHDYLVRREQVDSVAFGRILDDTSDILDSAARLQVRQWRSRLPRDLWLALRDALLDALDYAALQTVVRIGLSQKLEHISRGKNLVVDVEELLDWSEEHDKLTALIMAARFQNATNKALAAAQQRLEEYVAG